MHEPRSCASCDEAGCGMHRHFQREQAAERTAWLLDSLWPETASMVAASFGPDDQLLAPAFPGGWNSRYRWPVRSGGGSMFATMRRHWSMRRVAKAAGAVRQQAYLAEDRRLARKLAGGIDFRARHLVIAQNWLPWLDEAGVLGGRTFDVVMSRYPFAEIHRLLDRAREEIGVSDTIADFRAPAQLAGREAALLARARRIYTPHHGIAGLFPGRAVKLAWHVPLAKECKPGSRVAFLGPTIARQRPDIVRRLAVGLQAPLIVFGPILEPLWDCIEVERRERGAGWLDGVGAILHPATMTHEPRALLEARASGVDIYATETCGLDPSEYQPIDQFSPAWRDD